MDGNIIISFFMVAIIFSPTVLPFRNRQKNKRQNYPRCTYDSFNSIGIFLTLMLTYNTDKNTLKVIVNYKDIICQQIN